MRYTIEQAYELGYALAYRGEMINGGSDAALHETRLGRATHSIWRDVEAVITGGDAANYELAVSYARGSNAGYEAARAELASRAAVEA